MSPRTSLTHPPNRPHANTRTPRANAPIMLQRAIRRANGSTQRDKRGANFSTWRANVPKGESSFWKFLLQNAKGNFCTLLLYKKFYIIVEIIAIHMCICVLHKNYIKLHFYASCFVQEKCVEFFFLLLIFLLSSLVRNENIKDLVSTRHKLQGFSQILHSENN